MWHRQTAHSILPKEGKKAENPLKINELSTIFGGGDGSCLFCGKGGLGSGAPPAPHSLPSL